MNAMQWKSGWGRWAGGALGAGVLLATVGCGTQAANSGPAASQAANQTGVPVVVSCEPHQRTIVRPVMVDGAAMSQVECVATGQVPAAVASAAAQPLVAAQPAAPRQVVAPQPVYDDLGDARVIPASTTSGAARPVRTRQVVYEERQPVKQGRSVKKSAIIIGSSAGVGAGVGAAVGGKKGALIGAAIGGGSATVWDQVTRRND